MLKLLADAGGLIIREPFAPAAARRAIPAACFCYAEQIVNEFIKI